MSISQVNLPAPSSTADTAEFEACFKKVEEEVRGVPEASLIAVNLDVQSVVATVLGSLPEIRAFRGEISQLGGFDLKRFDRLRDYALALAHTQAMYRAASGPADTVALLADEMMNARDVLQSDAIALGKRRILDLAVVNKLRSGNGYKNTAFEVIGLARLFRDNWARIEGHSALRLDELDRVERRAQDLMTAAGLREQAPVVTGAAAALRQRTFTLLVQAYDEARRAIAFLRWHEGDADDIAPSLYAGRTGRNDEVVPAPGVPAVPGPNPAPGPVNSGTPAAPQGVGLPGSSPFRT